MKLYDTPRAPNPRRVRIFLAEKGVSVPTLAIDLAKLEHKTDDFLAMNPIGRTPVLILDDGTAIADSVAICRYVEEMHPEPPLLGTEPREKALIAMWERHIELHFLQPVFDAFRHGNKAVSWMENPQFPDFAEARKPVAIDFLRLLDRQLASHPFVAGERFSGADISALCGVDFMKPAKIAMPDDLLALSRWHKDVSSRPSAVP